MANAPILHPDDTAAAEQMMAGEARSALNAITQVQRLVDGVSRLLDERARLATGKKPVPLSGDEEREAHYDPDLPTPDEIELLAIIESGGDPLTSDIDTAMAQRTFDDLKTINEISMTALASRIEPDFTGLPNRAQWLAKLTRSHLWPQIAPRIVGLTEHTGKRLRSLVDPRMWKVRLAPGAHPPMDLAWLVADLRRENPAPAETEHAAALDGATVAGDAYPVGAAGPDTAVERTATSPAGPLAEAGETEGIYWAPEMRLAGEPGRS